MNKFDAIIIGTGQAGPSLAARFSAAGKTVAIIERHKFGGTCVNTGCIPTKTLVASAYAAHVARRGAEYGFAVNGDVRVDMKRVKARKDAVSGRSNKGVEEWLRGLKNCTVIQGHARFQSSDTVVVNDEVLQADKIYINVGGRAICSRHAGDSRCPVSHQLIDDGSRFLARSISSSSAEVMLGWNSPRCIAASAAKSRLWKWDRA